MDTPDESPQKNLHGSTPNASDKMKRRKAVLYTMTAAIGTAIGGLLLFEAADTRPAAKAQVKTPFGQLIRRSDSFPSDRLSRVLRAPRTAYEDVLRLAGLNRLDVEDSVPPYILEQMQGKTE